MLTETFYGRFRWLTILCAIGGIYVPGFENVLPNTYKPILYLYFAIFYSFSLTAVVDGTILLSTGLPFDWMFFGTIGLHFCINLLSMYMLTQQTNLNELIKTWEELRPEISPEIRKEIIDNETNILFSKFKKYVVFLMAPCTCFDTYSIYRCTLILPSLLGIGYETRTSNSISAFPQAICFISIIITYSAYQCLMESFLRLMLAELKFLRTSLDIILNELPISENGCITYTDSVLSFQENYFQSCRDINTKLNQYLKYHIQVLQFCNMTKSMYESTVFFEYYEYGLIMSVALYGCVMVDIDYDMIMIFAVVFCFLCVINGFKCILGDDIRDTSVRVGDAAFHGNWMAYPIKIQKKLVMIINITQQRPVMFEYVGMYPLLIETFGQMLYMQYTFVRFVYDTKPS